MPNYKVTVKINGDTFNATYQNMSNEGVVRKHAKEMYAKDEDTFEDNVEIVSIEEIQ